jgi:hypothetical protein
VKAPKKIMEPLRAQNAPLVEEALKYLNQALANRPNYEEAMTYINLVYRARASVNFDNPVAVKADLASAREWTAKAMDTRKKNEEKKNQGPGGITMDAQGNLK